MSGDLPKTHSDYLDELNVLSHKLNLTKISDDSDNENIILQPIKLYVNNSTSSGENRIMDGINTKETHVINKHYYITNPISFENHSRNTISEKKHYKKPINIFDSNMKSKCECCDKQSGSNDSQSSYNPPVKKKRLRRRTSPFIANIIRSNFDVNSEYRAESAVNYQVKTENVENTIEEVYDTPTQHIFPKVTITECDKSGYVNTVRTKSNYNDDSCKYNIIDRLVKYSNPYNNTSSISNESTISYDYTNLNVLDKLLPENVLPHITIINKEMITSKVKKRKMKKYGIKNKVEPLLGIMEIETCFQSSYNDIVNKYSDFSPKNYRESLTMDEMVSENSKENVSLDKIMLTAGLTVARKACDYYTFPSITNITSLVIDLTNQIPLHSILYQRYEKAKKVNKICEGTIISNSKESTTTYQTIAQDILSFDNIINQTKCENKKIGEVYNLSRIYQLRKIQSADMNFYEVPECEKTKTPITSNNESKFFSCFHMCFSRKKKKYFG